MYIYPHFVQLQSIGKNQNIIIHCVSTVFFLLIQQQHSDVRLYQSRDTDHLAVPPLTVSRYRYNNKENYTQTSNTREPITKHTTNRNNPY